MDQGEIGNCMFVIYSGECGVYIFKANQKGRTNSHQAVAILGPNTVVGEGAVLDKFDSGVRNATVLAHSEVVAMTLTKEDYQKLFYQYTVMERQRRLEFLSSLSLFKSWDRVSLIDFNNHADELKVSKGTTIYNIGQDAETIYVVRRGKLIMETVIEIDSYFRFPIDKQTWEVRKKTRQIRYKLQDACRGQIFGHEEILQGYKRRCRVRCLTDCSLIYVNSTDILKWWPKAHIEELRKTMRNLDLDFMVDKITRFYKEKTKRNTAVLDSAGLNCHDFSGARSQFMQNSNQR